MTRLSAAIGLLLIAGCGSEEGGDGPPALVASVVEVIQGDGQIDTVGQQLPLAIRIQVLDTASAEAEPGLAPTASPVPVPGQVVNFVVTSGGGTVFAGAAITDSIGRAQELWTLGPTAGTQCLEARAVDQETGEPLTFAQVCATAVAGAVAEAGFLLDSVTVFAGGTVGLPVFAEDAFGNEVAIAGVVGLDSLTADSTAVGWQTDALVGGRHRFAYFGDTLTVLVYPPEGHWSFDVTAGDTTFSVHGWYTNRGRNGGCVGADRPADDMVYRADSLWVVVTAPTVDTLVAGGVGTQVGSCGDAEQPGHSANGGLWLLLPSWGWLELAGLERNGGSWHYDVVQPDWTATQVTGELTITP